ncbi:MAG TPA: type II secretion system protein GspJ [Tepidisphaeraceae bacterium]|nr:type II secretion system protein GspJ [Tepidisphaeraceae bacterium]
MTGGAISTQRRAFTLLELLVALAITAIIMGSLYASLRIAFRARAAAEAAAEPLRTAELALGLLRSDVESAMLPRGILTAPFTGEDGMGSAGQPADKLSFCSLGDPGEFMAAVEGGASSAVPSEVRKVGIALEPYAGPDGAEQYALVRYVTTNLLSPVEQQPDKEVLCRGVTALNIRYFDGLAWQDSWDSTTVENNIPSAVEVTIEIVRTQGERTRGVRLPRVFLLSCSTLSPTSTMEMMNAGDAGTGTGTGTGTGGAPQ